MTNTDFDKGNILGSIQSLPDQCIHAWEEANKVVVPDEYKDIKNIVFCGMGGSGLGARIIESVYLKELKYPLLRINDYHLPFFCDHHTLVICSSYSGETEETIQNALEAIDKKCKWMVISKGGRLIELAKRNNVPYYQIDVRYNPSNQPRMAIGYSVISQMVLSSKVDLFNINKSEINKIVQAMKKIQLVCGIKNTTDNPAYNISQKIFGKAVLFFSASHLIGATHTINNQMNENSKNISFDFSIPEANHHLMEGLKHPLANKNNLYALLIYSDIYPTRIKQRLSVTREILNKNGIENDTISFFSDDKLSQNFELIQFGEYINYYICSLYNQDPSPIPWVDFFKIQLGQSLGK